MQAHTHVHWFKGKESAREKRGTEREEREREREDRERERTERERERERDGSEERRTLLTCDAFLPVHMMRLAIAGVAWRDPAGEMG